MNFKKTRKKEYPFLIGISCIMLGQTLLYTFFLLFMKKEVSNYPKSKAYRIWIILYVIRRVVKTLPEPCYFYFFVSTVSS